MLTPDQIVEQLRMLRTQMPATDPLTDEEDLHATAAAVYGVLLGATERGLASYWRTPACFSEPDVREVHIEIVWDPAWSKARLSEDGIDIMRTWGIAS